MHDDAVISAAGTAHDAGPQPDDELLQAALALGRLLTQHGIRVAVAESCTGGLVGAALTHWPGSSAWFEGGVIGYSNRVKHDLLRVPDGTLQQHGAVSAAVAADMATGALRGLPDAAVALSVTGVAGPDGGTADKPVGTVWFGWALRGADGGEPLVITGSVHFGGGRQAVRRAAAMHALREMARHLNARQSDTPMLA